MSDAALPILFWLLFGWIGLLIGQRKGRPTGGFLLGVLLGPLGWLVVALGPSYLPKCPACLGHVNPRASMCRHCGSFLVSSR